MQIKALANTAAAGFIVIAVLSTPGLGTASAAAARSGGIQAAVFDGSDVKSQPVVTNNNDGSKFLESLITRIKQLGAYKFEGTLATLKEREVKVDAGAFFYMPQSCLRVEVKGKGFKAGSVLVKQKDGMIRAKGGPALLGMKVNLEPDSNMLRLANGLNIVQCDFLSLFSWLKSQIASGQKVYASDGPVTIQSQSNRVLVLETRDAGQSQAVSHRILVDPQQMVPVEWDIFRGGNFFSTVRFKDFQQCPNFDEKLFKL